MPFTLFKQMMLLASLCLWWGWTSFHGCWFDLLTEIFVGSSELCYFSVCRSNFAAKFWSLNTFCHFSVGKMCILLRVSVCCLQPIFCLGTMCFQETPSGKEVGCFQGRGSSAEGSAEGGVFSAQITRKVHCNMDLCFLVQSKDKSPGLCCAQISWQTWWMAKLCISESRKAQRWTLQMFCSECTWVISCRLTAAEHVAHPSESSLLSQSQGCSCGYASQMGYLA